MSNYSSFRNDIVSLILEHFPPSIRDALLSDQSFLDEYGYTAESRLSFNEIDVSFLQSELFEAIRSAFKDPSAETVIIDTSNKEWKLNVDDAATGNITLCKGEKCLILPYYWPLLPQVSKRILTFDEEADIVNLPQEIIELWRIRLAHDRIDDNFVNEVLSELRDTPTSVMDSIKSRLRHHISLLSLIPNSSRYFHRLVGAAPCADHYNLIDHILHGIKDHIEQLISWRPKDGMEFALLLSVHPSIVSTIDLDKVGRDTVVEVFKNISKIGDRVSQTGAIELGLSKILVWPEIEPQLIEMIEQIRDDNPNEGHSRFKVLSSLIILVDGQLSNSKLFNDKPSFWRRLASITHASLIERCLIGVPIDEEILSNWITQNRGQQFYLQTLCDLRNEPRWLPDFVSADQLKMEFIGRILNVALLNADAINRFPKLTELLLSEGPSGLKCLFEMPFPFFPGPLEGGLEPIIDLPAVLEEAIQQNLAADKLESNSFTALINSALVFKMKPLYAKMAARALREAKHYIKQGEKINLLFPLLNGLAVVAAISRSTELAEELRLLSRRSMHQIGNRITQDQCFLIALISASSHVDLKDWCSFVGEWLTELAFEDLSFEDAKKIHSHIKCLCHIEPELWLSLGRAEAALTALISN